MAASDYATKTSPLRTCAEGGVHRWITDSLVELDAVAPGLVCRVLTASPMSRHAIFSVLAARLAGGLDCSAADDAKLAVVMREGRAREILGLAFGAVSEGWLGALERLGGEPLGSPHAYLKVRAILTDPEHRRKAAALRHVGRITEKMLAIADMLDERWLHPEALKRLPSVVAAKDFNRAVAFAQSVASKATDEAVAEAIARLTPTAPLSRVVERFVRRADRFPAHPVAGDEEIRPLASARDLIEAGRRYRNCLVTKLDEALSGRAAFAEFRRECIVEFRPLTLDRGWLLYDIHIERNDFVDKEVADAARRKCEALGIPRIGGDDEDEGWVRYRRFMRSKGYLLPA